MYTHTHDHISQQLNSLADTTQQHQVYTNEVDASLFTGDSSTLCELSDSTVKFTFGNEMEYFNTRSEGPVQANNF